MRWFKVLVLTAFIVVAVFIYVKVVLLWGGYLKKLFFRKGQIEDYVLFTLLTWIYVQIIKQLWKWQVRVLSGL